MLWPDRPLGERDGPVVGYGAEVVSFGLLMRIATTPEPQDRGPAGSLFLIVEEVKLRLNVAVMSS